MNSYFFKLTKEERENILDKHKTLYDGYAVRQNPPNMTPLYVQDFANDKGGITVNGKGEVGKYNNKLYIKESQDVCEQCGSKLVEGDCMECGGSMMEDDMCNECGGSMMEDDMCNECGGKMMEGECMECGGMYKEMEEGYYDKSDLGHSKFDYTEKELGEGIFSKLLNKVKKEIGYENPEDKIRPYMADAVATILRLIKNVENEEHLESVKNMIDNLKKTNSIDMNAVYRQKIETALNRKAEDLGVRLSNKDYKKIMKDVKENLEFSEDIDEVEKSIKESLDWFNKFKKYN